MYQEIRPFCLVCLTLFSSYFLALDREREEILTNEEFSSDERGKE